MSDHFTVEELIAQASEQLAAAGCDSPASDAVDIVHSVFSAHAPAPADSAGAVPEDRQRAIAALIERRVGREPLAYILGAVRFRSLTLYVDRRVHIPRADRSGLLVETAIALPPRSRVHDVGTGSGAIGLAIKAERPDLIVSASDISRHALEVATRNAAELGLEVELTRARDLPAQNYDLVVACLPYAVTRTIATAHSPETAVFQPHVALAAGEDGLDAIKDLIASAPHGTPVALEHSPAQGPAVRALLTSVATLRDPAGTDRVTLGRVP